VSSLAPGLRRLRRTRLFRAIGRWIHDHARIAAVSTEIAEVKCVRFRAACLGLCLDEVRLVTRTACDDPLTGYWLMSLSVRPLFRRMGIGAALCRAVLETARDRGAEAVRLTVRHDNESATSLYQKLGFRILPPTAEFAPELERMERLGGAPYVAMEAKLTSGPP